MTPKAEIPCVSRVLHAFAQRCPFFLFFFFALDVCTQCKHRSRLKHGRQSGMHDAGMSIRKCAVALRHKSGTLELKLKL